MLYDAALHSPEERQLSKAYVSSPFPVAKADLRKLLSYMDDDCPDTSNLPMRKVLRRLSNASCIWFERGEASDPEFGPITDDDIVIIMAVPEDTDDPELPMLLDLVAGMTLRHRGLQHPEADRILQYISRPIKFECGAFGDYEDADPVDIISATAAMRGDNLVDIRVIPEESTDDTYSVRARRIVSLEDYEALEADEQKKYTPYRLSDLLHLVFGDDRKPSSARECELKRSINPAVIARIREAAADGNAKLLADRLIPLYQDYLDGKLDKNAYSRAATSATLEWERATGEELLDYFDTFLPVLIGLPAYDRGVKAFELDDDFSAYMEKYFNPDGTTKRAPKERKRRSRIQRRIPGPMPAGRATLPGRTICCHT